VDLPQELIAPTRLWSREEVLGGECPVPRMAGVYAWYFRVPPTKVPLEGCVQHEGLTLLYIGIAPKEPARNGRPPSRQTLWNRIRSHYRGNAAGSTLRLSLGCLLADQLGIKLCKVGSGNKVTFREGEHVLSAWMAENAYVCWHITADPSVLEEKLIGKMCLPLNLDMNIHPFRARLSALRPSAKQAARGLASVASSP